MKHSVLFQPDNITVSVEKGENLLTVAADAGVYVHAYCGGDGVCGKCIIKIDQGEVRAEKATLKQEEWNQGIRLACKAHVESDLVITVPEKTKAGGKALKRKPKTTRTISAKSLDSLVGKWDVNPPVTKIYIELDPPTMDDNISDMARVMRTLRNIKPDSPEPSYDHPELIKELPFTLRESDWKVTLLMLHGKKQEEPDRIIDIEPGDTTNRLYGLAVDIGTTTCSGVLIDLNSGEIIAEIEKHLAIHIRKKANIDCSLKIDIGTKVTCHNDSVQIGKCKTDGIKQSLIPGIHCSFGPHQIVQIHFCDNDIVTYKGVLSPGKYIFPAIGSVSYACMIKGLVEFTLLVNNFCLKEFRDNGNQAGATDTTWFYSTYGHNHRIQGFRVDVEVLYGSA